MEGISMSAPDTTVVARVRAVLGEVIGPSVTQLDNPSRDTVPEWDSLAQVEVLFALEEEFSFRFPGDQLGTLRSLEAIVEALEHD
jgi:acyl carrier protein